MFSLSAEGWEGSVAMASLVEGWRPREKYRVRQLFLGQTLGLCCERGKGIIVGSSSLACSPGGKPVLRIRDVYPGSRILIFTHPGSRISDPGSRIPHPKTGRKERGEKKFFVKHFFVATNFTKCKITIFNF
jgi:hypothetical protein